MSSSSWPSRSEDTRRKVYIFAAAAVCVAVTGLFTQDVIAYFAIAAPATAPLFIWLRSGARGVPVLPLVSALFFVYYAVPFIRPDILAYSSDELFRAAATVGIFLLAASVASWPFLGGRTAYGNRRIIFSDMHIVQITFLGLGGGIVYYLAVASGSLDWLGMWLGLIRSIVLALTSVCCYLLGYARATKLLAGGTWALALGCMLVLVLLSLSNLLLVGAVMNGLAAFVGYIVAARRLPWVGMAAAFAVLAILHAGKFEIREKYWLPHSQTLQQNSLAQIPGLMIEWFSAGIDALSSDRKESSVLERTSLLHMVLLVQRATPDAIPYLEGETYALLPSMLVPRFIDSEKTISQAGLNLLSIRYGLQHAESQSSTTIGWGLVAEAFANFGYLGVIIIGAMFGAVCGAVTRLSTGVEVNSLPMFVTIAATLVLFNLEADFAILVVTLFQTVAGIFLSSTMVRLVAGRARFSRFEPSPTSHRPFGQAPPR
jgi:hypothetical protein